MAAALGTIRLAEAGRIRSLSIYCNDTSNNPVYFDETKVASTNGVNEYIIKKQCSLVDVCLTSDVATPTHLQITINGAAIGDILDCTAHLASVVNRPNPAIPLQAGDKLKIIQIA